MIIGVPKEIKEMENRVGATPAGVCALKVGSNLSGEIYNLMDALTFDGGGGGGGNDAAADAVWLVLSCLGPAA